MMDLSSLLEYTASVFAKGTNNRRESVCHETNSLCLQAYHEEIEIESER